MKSLRKQRIIIFLLLSLILAACGGSDTAEEETVETTAAPAESLDSPSVTTAQAIKTGVGVTEEACPASYNVGGTDVPTGANPDQGCIYLGLLNDYTGPYAAAAGALELAQRAFWLWANTSGGIGGYSVAIIDGKDTGYSPAKHLEGYNAIRDEVAALAMSLGTVQTLFIMDEMDKDNMVAAPMSWYSGWGYKSFDRGLVAEFGSAYCVDGMNALDWGLENLPKEINTVGILAYAGEYGDDYAAGVRKAAIANGVTVSWSYVPPVAEFDVAAALGLMLTQPVDAVFSGAPLSAGPQIIGGYFQQTGELPFIFNAAPAYNDAFIGEGFPVRDLYLSGAVYNMAWVGPFETDTPGHAAMRATWGNFSDSASSYVVAGWSSQYHIKGVLEAAAKGGDLTRAGIRRAASNVTVESDGMMTPRELGLDGPDPESTITAPDASVGSGSATVKANYAGPTASAYDWSQGPCS